MRNFGRSCTIVSRFLFGLFFCTTGFSYGSEFRRISGDITSVEFDAVQKYYIAESDIEIPEGKTVVIPGGVVICFRPGTTFRINGQCTINGSETSRAVLTSMNDSLYCSSPNAPGPYDWNGVEIVGSAQNVTFNYTDIKYAQTPLLFNAQTLTLKQIRRLNTASPFFIINEQQIKIPQDSTIDLEYPQSTPATPPPVVANTPESDTNSTTLPSPSKPILPPAPKPSTGILKRTARWSLLGTGSAAVISTGTTLIISHLEHKKADDFYKEYLTSTAKENGSELYDNYLKKDESSNSLKLTSLVTGIASALLFAGFGLTFYF